MDKWPFFQKSYPQLDKFKISGTLEREYITKKNSLEIKELFKRSIYIKKLRKKEKMSVHNSNENHNSDGENEKSAIPEITDELKNPKKFCNSRCTICASGILPEIHEWRKDGKHFDRIVELASEIKGVTISAPSLCRHFQAYNKWRTEQATLVIKNDALEEITAQSVHIRRTVNLIDMAYDQLEAKLKSGLYKVDVSDLEKLTKMRYQILNGQDANEKDMFAIFQKASDEYGLNLQQATLFTK